MGDEDEFEAAFDNENVKQDLLRIGIDPDDVTSLFSEIDEDGSGQVSLDEFISGFITLRNPAKAHERLMQTLAGFFAEFCGFGADTLDEAGRVALSRGRFRKLWL